ncbi:MAG: FAD-dependent oxidoreductase [Phycisphaerae bacterium]
MTARNQRQAGKARVRGYDVVVAGGGTAGVVAALAAARNGAKTCLIESKGYLGGLVVEGGTALHSFYNLYTGFDGVEKRQVVRGIPQEIIDRLAEVGGTSGHGEMLVGLDYDSVCTVIDTELYKLIAHEMLSEAGVHVLVNTLLTGADTDGGRVTAAVVESRSGREKLTARTFIDCTGYGDLSAYAGAEYSEPNDYPVANSMGVGGVSMEGLHDWLKEHDAIFQHAVGRRSGVDGQITRLQGTESKLPKEFVDGAREIGFWPVTTTVHDDYFMFIKLNYKLPVSPTDRDAVAAAELELRRRQKKAIELIRRHIPGCEKAFITRTSPSVCIRRGRCVRCDYDMTLEDITGARHFEDDVMAYGFHDSAPKFQIAGGGTYGLPYRAIRPTGLDNLLVAGMMITSDHDAHMSTRNTVCCMGQGQAAGTAAALCAADGCSTRKLPYEKLRAALEAGGVYFES